MCGYRLGNLSQSEAFMPLGFDRRIIIRYPSNKSETVLSI